MNVNELIKVAAPHFSITKEGELSRDSVPFKSKTRQPKLGVGFDHINGNGYKQFNHSQTRGIRNVKIQSHRMIYYLTHKSIPHQVDHIDNDRSNNHPTNLREASPTENSRNQSSHKDSSSKYLGVSWYKGRGKWRCVIHTKGKQIFIGAYYSEREAAEAYNVEALRLFGEFANVNEF